MEEVKLIIMIAVAVWYFWYRNRQIEKTRKQVKAGISKAFRECSDGIDADLADIEKDFHELSKSLGKIADIYDDKRRGK